MPYIFYGKFDFKGAKNVFDVIISPHPLMPIAIYWCILYALVYLRY